MFVLIPETINPVVPKPTVESTVKTLAPADTFVIDLVIPGIVKVPSIKSLSLNPTNKPNLKYNLFFLVKGETSETDAAIGALVAESDDLIIVWPNNFNGFPFIASTKTISLLIYSADDGFIKYSSKSTTFGVSLYNTLNKILKDSSVPLDW